MLRRRDELERLGGVIQPDLFREINALIEFYDEMKRQLPLREGDRVALTRNVLNIDYDKADGWAAYQGILQPSNTGTLENVDWSPWSKKWTCMVQFDIQWYSVQRGETKCIYLKNNANVFAFSPSSLRLAVPGDEPILPPFEEEHEYHLTPRSSKTTPMLEAKQLLEEMQANLKIELEDMMDANARRG